MFYKRELIEYPRPHSAMTQCKLCPIGVKRISIINVTIYQAQTIQTHKKKFRLRTEQRCNSPESSQY